MKNINRRDFIKAAGTFSLLYCSYVFPNLAFAKTVNVKEKVLSNGVKIPALGFGTWKNKGSEGRDAIIAALKMGYRQIDTAAVYDNEKEVGDAIKNSGVKREDIFVTTKLANSITTYDHALNAFNQSIEKLQLEYVDLYLIHWPRPSGIGDKWLERNLSVWRAFERLYNDKKIRAIGVSNFYVNHLKEFNNKVEIKPMVNQIECHPFYADKDTVKYCNKNNIAIQAYTPLGKTPDSLKNQVLQSIAKKHKKTVAQIMLRWSIQSGFIPLPKSATPNRIQENFNIFDFELDSTDLKNIAKLNNPKNEINPHPDRLG